MPKGEIVGIFTDRALEEQQWYGFRQEQHRQDMIVIDGKNNNGMLQAEQQGYCRECAFHLMENRLGSHRKSRQEECTDGGQISGIRSECGD
jgi:hypothetical protein